MKLKYVDRIHAYYLDGKRCKGVSTCAKIPDDQYALDQWRKRQVAIGLAKAPHLLESVAAHYTENGKLNELCEEAMVIAGASDAAHSGTAAHRVTENVDTGKEQILTKTGIAVAANWKQALAIAGLEIVHDLIEQVVVYPEERICGRYDRIARRLSDGALVPVDLKTGQSAINYPHSVATQLAMYANAPLMARLPDGLDGVTEEFTTLPADLDRSVGYMIHMPADGETTVYTVNLKLGWKAVEQIVFPALRWRALPNSKLIKPIVK